MEASGRRALWVSAALSITLHVVVIGQLATMDAQRAPGEPPVVVARLQVAKSPSPAPADAAGVTTPPVRPARERPVAAPVPVPAPPSTPESIAQRTVAAATPPAEAEAADAETATELPTAAPQTLAQPSDLQAQERPPEPYPSAGTISYEVRWGGGPIGEGIHRWRIEAASYRMSTVLETTGLAAALRPYRYALSSEGLVDASGLRPERFSAERGSRRDRRRSIAQLDWTAGQLTLGSAASPRQVPLPQGTQDLLSFVYQLARSPLTPGRREVVLTSGSRLAVYVLEIGAPEMVDLPVGTTRTIPVRQLATQGEERMELWLAAEPPRLPLQIRFFERNGRMTIEQLATRIQTDGP